MVSSSKLEAVLQPLPPGLYVVATPIGNIRDITLRALDVLAAVTAVACEDTRRTGLLLHHYGIDKPLLRYDDASGARSRDLLMQRLAAGESLALVSDAGTPLIADPGYKLVRAARQAGHAVYPLPGACAAIAALSAAAMPSNNSYFAGFVPPKSAARRAALQELVTLPATLILYETGNRLTAFLEDAAVVFGDRPVMTARELTKVFETFAGGVLGQWQPEVTLGEFVVLIAGNTERVAASVWQEAADARVHSGDTPPRVAAAIAEAFGVSRREVYQYALKSSARP